MKPYYDHGGITIFHGDCREVVPTLQGVDLVLTDPPYSIRHVEGLTDFVLLDYVAVLSCADELVAFHSRDQISEYANWIKGCFGNYDLHVWHKTNAIPFTNNVWKSDLEYIALGWRNKKHAKVEQHEKSKLYQSGIECDRQHPAQKPTELLAKYITVLNPTVICDPFMGGGVLHCELLKIPAAARLALR